MIRVLHVFHEMANGGIEHFVMDYYRHIDRNRVQFDFLVSVDRPGYFDEEIKALGGKMHHAYPLKKNPLKNYISVAQIVRDNRYTIVHRHTGSAFGYFDLRAARHGGANHLILHSHNNQAGNMMLHKICNAVLKIDCERLACSQEAGEWLFRQRGFQVISNAIECDRFQFDPAIRKRVRDSLGLQDKFVMVHVGRFESQKNHKFLLQVLKKVTEKNPDSLLMCVGVGSLLDEIRQEAERLELQKNILFLGTRHDVNELLQGADVFVLPSVYEGFPFVLVEAQASGLKAVVSKNVPGECDVTGNISFVSLNDGLDEWAEEILNAGTTDEPRAAYASYMREKGLDICENAKKLCEYYEALGEKS